MNNLLNLIGDNCMIFENPKRLSGPFGWIGHIPFSFFITQLLKPKILVELGVHTGNSYNAFCQAIDYLKIDTKCYGVDHWKGDVQAEFYDESIFSDLKQYQEEHYKSFSLLLRMDFDDATEYFDNGVIDILHIDGFHTYEAVKHDFFNWLPKMSDHSVVLFHDTQLMKSGFGVHKFWEEISSDYPSFEFYHSFGLGILKTGEKADDLLFSLEKQNKDFIRNFFRKLGNGLLGNVAISEAVKILVPETQGLHPYYNDLKNKFDEERNLLEFIDQLSILREKNR